MSIPKPSEPRGIEILRRSAGASGCKEPCGSGGAATNAPIAPGLYRQVPVRDVKRVNFEEEVQLAGPSTLAFDGDREHQVLADTPAIAVVRRDGPRVVNVARTLEAGASEGIFVTR